MSVKGLYLYRGNVLCAIDLLHVFAQGEQHAKSTVTWF